MTAVFQAATGPTWNGVDLNWAYTDLLPSIHNRTKCLQRAEDVLHDALLRLALIDKGETIKQPHAYLRVIVRSVLANQFNADARFIDLPDIKDEDSKIITDRGEFAPSAEHLAELHQRLQAAQRILDCLPPRCREVFWLFRIEGYTQPEIAVKLGITVKIVERHVMRALIDIRTAREAMA